MVLNFEVRENASISVSDSGSPGSSNEMQFLVKHNGLKGFLEEGDNLQEEVDHTNTTRDRKHHVVPTHMHEK